MSKIYCVITAGDSITGSASCYPFQGLSLTSRGGSTHPATQATAVYSVPGDIVFQNFAVSGTRLTSSDHNMTTVGTTYIDPTLTNKSTAPSSGLGSTIRPDRKYILSFLPGSNDGCVVSGSVPDFITNVLSYCAARKAAGFDAIILGTVLPRSDPGSPLSELNRLAYNSTITAPGWAAANGIDGIFDFAADPIMGVHANTTNLTYYSDKIHPTTAGFAILAPIWRAKLDEIIASL